MINRSRDLFCAFGKCCPLGHQWGGKSWVQVIHRHLKAVVQQAARAGGPKIAKPDIPVMHDVPVAGRGSVQASPDLTLIAITDDALDLAEVMDAPIGIFAPVA